MAPGPSASSWRRWTRRAGPGAAGWSRSWGWALNSTSAARADGAYRGRRHGAYVTSGTRAAPRTWRACSREMSSSASAASGSAPWPTLRAVIHGFTPGGIYRVTFVSDRTVHTIPVMFTAIQPQTSPTNGASRAARRAIAATWVARTAFSPAEAAGSTARKQASAWRLLFFAFALMAAGLVVTLVPERVDGAVLGDISSPGGGSYVPTLGFLVGDLCLLRGYGRRSPLRGTGSSNGEPSPVWE